MGTFVDSQSTVNYLEPLSFVSVNIVSNRVRAVVSGVPGIELLENRTGNFNPGDSFVFSHVLTNTGDMPDTFLITPVRSGDAIDLSNLVIVEDLNANGLYDVGEPQRPFSAFTVALNPGQSFAFLITAQISAVLPPALASGGSVLFDITASGTASGLSATNRDTLNVGNNHIGGGLEMRKRVNPVVASPGDIVTYRITGTNTASITYEPTLVTVNGASANYFIVRDDIPVNMEFVDATAFSGAVILYRHSGDGSNSYWTTRDASRRVSTVAWAFASMPSGGSFDLFFTARVGSRASGTINNVAESLYRLSGANQNLLSNIAALTLPTVAPQIRYFRDNNFNEVIPVTSIGNQLFIQLDAGVCNRNPDLAESGAGSLDQVWVELTSALSGDSEVFRAEETGVNTGIFRVVVPVPTVEADSITVTPMDGTLQLMRNDNVKAAVVSSPSACAKDISTNILIDPHGIVYDSRTGTPIANALVSLLDASGAPAAVRYVDGTSGAPHQFRTGTDGVFRFPVIANGTYRLHVEAPDGYTFLSAVPSGLLPSSRRTHPQGSFGQNFSINGGGGSVVFDVPLDTTSGGGMKLSKEASVNNAEIGDSVIYTLKLTNNSGADFRGTYIDDRLPVGFKYERGTTRRDGATVADPAGGVGPALRFDVGTLADGASVIFTYRVRLVPGAEKGDGINTAQATSMGPPVLVSGKAYARVKPRAGIFDPRGVIIGTVFVDANNNGIQDPGEPGVPGVRLVLEDGTYVITDSQGKYSVYGQRALTHVLKVDTYSLPVGAKLGGKSPAFALDPGSRFVDMKNYELHKANFMLVEPTPELYEEIARRREQAEKWQPEFSAALDYNFTADGIRQESGEIQSRDASGVVGGKGSAPFENILPAGTLTHGNSTLPEAPVAAVPLFDLEYLVKDIKEPQLGFIGLKEGDTLPYSQATVRIVGDAEAKLALFINGESAPEARIGKIVRQTTPPLQAIEYVALNFKPGNNLLELVQYDLFGNARERKHISVTAPDQMASIQVQYSTLSPAADGRTPVEVSVQMVDKNGVPVTASIPVTLQASVGRWDVTDLDPAEPGIQVFLDKGRGTYLLYPPIEPGAATVIVSSGKMKAEQRLDFMPELRPLIAVGVIEGRISLSNISSNNILPVNPNDAFDESLREIAGIGADGQLGGRAAFYLKGKISGKTLLTVAYDSQKKRGETELFRDIDPDAFYPVYGDDSIKGYDAQSSGSLYVRVDHGRSYALVGDYNTRANNEVRQLGEYNRSFNGARLHYETSSVAADFWVTDDSSTQVIEEFPANGTSGPFFFPGGDIVLNSETVEIVIRDRNQPSMILETKQLTRYTDYDFEPFSGRLLLYRPVATYDANFNPQYIRLTFERERVSGSRFFTYGGSVQAKLHERIEIGGAFVRDDNPAATFEMESVNGTIKLAEGTYLITEGARTNSMVEGVGYAGRVDLRHQSDKTQARIFYAVTDPTFNNPSSQINAGRIEGGLKVTHDIAPRTQVIAEGVYTEDKDSSGNRRGIRLDLAHTFDNQVKVTVGGRVSEETQTPEDPSLGVGDPLEVRSLRLRVDTPIPGLPEMTVFGEYEQDVFEFDQRMLAVGGHYQVATRTRVYARHELISSLGSPFELNNSGQNNNTIFGVESEYMQDGYITNEYRIRDAIGGRQAEAATGLRNLWTVDEGVRINTTFERVTPFRNASDNKSTAATLGFEYTRPKNWKATARIEGRWANSSDNYLGTLGYAQKLTKEWTVLTRSIYNAQLAKDSGGGGGSALSNLYQARMLTGLAWRQAERDEWNALFRYEYKYEQGTNSLGTNSAGLQRHVQVLGVSVNYQPQRQWIFSGHYATKLVFESGGGYQSTTYMAHVLAGRVLFEVSERWDMGLNLAATFSNNIDNASYAVGPEIGYVIHENVRIGIGYNIVGFRDRDFDTAATEQGAFITMRIKFDENLLNWARFDN